MRRRGASAPPGRRPSGCLPLRRRREGGQDPAPAGGCRSRLRLDRSARRALGAATGRCVAGERPPGNSVRPAHRVHPPDGGDRACDHAVVRPVSLCVAAAALAGCGGMASQPPATAGSERQWRSNASIIVRQLQNEIATTQLAGDTARGARAALHDESLLYGLLVSYSDFGGCRSMVAAAGEAGRSQTAVARLLAASCKRLERASTLFTEAVTRDDGAGLLAAGDESRRALPLLVRAAAALRSTPEGS